MTSKFSSIRQNFQQFQDSKFVIAIFSLFARNILKYISFLPISGIILEFRDPFILRKSKFQHVFGNVITYDTSIELFLSRL